MENQKVQSFLSFLALETHFSPNIRGSIFSNASKSDALYLYKSNQVIGFVSCVEKLVDRSSEKSAIGFDKNPF